MKYRVIDALDGTVGQDCGTFTLAELPARIQAAIAASPSDGTWSLPALSGGDCGDELVDLRTVVVEEGRFVGGTYHGKTLAEVLRDRDEYNRACGGAEKQNFD